MALLLLYKFHTIIHHFTGSLLASSLKNYKKRHKSLGSPTEPLKMRTRWKSNEWNEIITILMALEERANEIHKDDDNDAGLVVTNRWSYFPIPTLMCFVIIFYDCT